MDLRRRINSVKFITAFLIFWITPFLKGQSGLDSLKKLYATAKHDTIRCDLLLTIATRYYANEPALYLEYNNKCRSLCEKNLNSTPIEPRSKATFTQLLLFSLNNIAGLQIDEGKYKEALEFQSMCAELSFVTGDTLKWAYSLMNIGATYNYLDRNREAYDHFNRAISLLSIIKDQFGVATAQLNLAHIYNSRSQIPEALTHLDAAEKILLVLGAKDKLAVCYNDKGYIYQLQGDYLSGLEYFEKSLALNESLNDKRGQANDLNNIGYIFSMLGNKQKALEIYEKCISFALELNDKRRLGGTYSNIGAIYLTLEKYEDAERYFGLGLKYYKEIGKPEGIATVLTSYGKLHLRMKQYNKAEKELEEALTIAKKIEYPESILGAALYLWKVYKLKGEPKKALETYELYVLMNDSVSNIKNKKASIRNQLKNEYEKNALADSVAHAKESEIKSAELKKQSAEIRAKNDQQIALVGGLGLVILFSIFMFNRFKVTQKQKIVIEHQKEIVEDQKQIVVEKQREILDSIHYAKRIQNALIPNEKMIQKQLQRLNKNKG